MTTLSGTITRTSLALPDLALFGSSPYHLVGGAGNEASSLQTGQVVHNNRSAESDFLNGAVLVHSRAGMRTMSMSWYVFGSSLSGVKADIETLLVAVNQASWTLTIVIDGVSRSWECWPADWAVSYDTPHVKGNVAQVNLTVPAQPGFS